MIYFDLYESRRNNSTKTARYITEMNWKSVDVKALAGCLQLEDGTSNQAPNVRVAINKMNCVEAPHISWDSLYTINSNVDCTGCVLEI